MYVIQLHALTRLASKQKKRAAECFCHLMRTTALENNIHDQNKKECKQKFLTLSGHAKVHQYNSYVKCEDFLPPSLLLMQSGNDAV